MGVTASAEVASLKNLHTEARSPIIIAVLGFTYLVTSNTVPLRDEELALTVVPWLSFFFAGYSGYDVLGLVSCSAGVRAFLKYLDMHALMFESAPGPSGDRGVRPLTLPSLVVQSAPVPQYTRHCPFGPFTDAVHGAVGHNRWEVAGTPLPVKTQSRNMGRSLTFNVYAVCRVAFNTSGRHLGSDGGRPQNRTARTADAPQRKCSRSAPLEERPATPIPSVAHGAGV